MGDVMMQNKGNIVFCGVGGQGIILASEITAYALLKAGFDVKKSEVHGMAQRGGSVVAHLRYGERVFSPLIERGTADMLISFELMESLRYFPYLNRESRVIVNTQKILPFSVATGKDQYPERVLEAFSERGISVFLVDVFKIAESLGELRVVNTIVVGALSIFLPLEEGQFVDVIRERVKKRFVDINIEAFKTGRGIISESVPV